MSVTTLTPRAGWYEDREREDDQRGFERDETDEYHQVVGRLVATGDAHARAAGRRARRTLAEMAPGYERQPVLLLTRPLVMGACASCSGAGGRTVDTSSNGVSRQHWQSCTTCGGSGVAR